MQELAAANPVEGWRSQQNDHLSPNQSLEPAHRPKARDCDVSAISEAGSPQALPGHAECIGRPKLRAETSDDYPKVVTLNSRWRVIACRHGIQWILQYRNRAETVARDVWRGRSYCRTREALIRVCDDHAGIIDPDARATLEGLPARFPEKQNAPGRITGSVSTNCAREVDYSKITPDTSACHDQEATKAA
jgi:hypothetical protein